MLRGIVNCKAQLLLCCCGVSVVCCNLVLFVERASKRRAEGEWERVSTIVAPPVGHIGSGGVCGAFRPKPEMELHQSLESLKAIDTLKIEPCESKGPQYIGFTR